MKVVLLKNFAINCAEIQFATYHENILRIFFKSPDRDISFECSSKQEASNFLEIIYEEMGGIN